MQNHEELEKPQPKSSIKNSFSNLSKVSPKLSSIHFLAGLFIFTTVYSSRVKSIQLLFNLFQTLFQVYSLWLLAPYFT